MSVGTPLTGTPPSAWLPVMARCTPAANCAGSPDCRTIIAAGALPRIAVTTARLSAARDGFCTNITTRPARSSFATSAAVIAPLSTRIAPEMVWPVRGPDACAQRSSRYRVTVPASLTSMSEAAGSNRVRISEYRWIHVPLSPAGLRPHRSYRPARYAAVFSSPGLGVLRPPIESCAITEIRWKTVAGVIDVAASRWCLSRVSGEIGPDGCDPPQAARATTASEMERRGCMGETPGSDGASRGRHGLVAVPMPGKLRIPGRLC